jgi:glycosyltransferase involved in cell wall biosynthesis
MLPAIWRSVREQTMMDIEWIVLDNSSDRAAMFDHIKDGRVRYSHRVEEMRIGTKRNELCSLATGEIIALFDDDDFYAPNYLARMLDLIDSTRADFVKLFGFFLYHRVHDLFGYWDLTSNRGPCYWVRPEGVLLGRAMRATVGSATALAMSSKSVFGRQCSFLTSTGTKIPNSRLKQ